MPDKLDVNGCYGNPNATVSLSKCMPCMMRLQCMCDRKRKGEKERENKVTKRKLHKKLNSAMSELLNVCLEVELKVMYNKLETQRTFIARLIDVSTLPDS